MKHVLYEVNKFKLNHVQSVGTFSICNLVLQFTREFSSNHVLVIHILFMKAVYTGKTVEVLPIS